MKNCSARRRLAVVLMAVSTASLAEAALTVDPTASTGTEGEVVKLEKFVVVGSNIPSAEIASEAGMFPVIRIGRPEISATGSENLAEVLQDLPVANRGAVSISNDGTGFARSSTAVSLRGLGPEATLVLFNGHRVANNPIGQGGTTSFVDLNTLQLDVLDNIQVLKDGASANYGADAVAGVVALNTYKHYNGSDFHIEYKNTTNKDESELTVSALSGVADDESSILVEFNYQHRNAITQADRFYSAIPAALSSNSSPINVQITVTAYDAATGASGRPSGVTSNTFFASPGPISSTGLPVASTNDGNVPASQYTYNNSRPSVYNFNQSEWALPEITRYGGYLRGDRRLTKQANLRAYYEASYQVALTENQLAPTPTNSFNTPGNTLLVIPANTPNPILTKVKGSTVTQVSDGDTLGAGETAGPGTTVGSDGKLHRIAPAGAYNPFNPFNQDISDGSRYRLAEFGNRIYRDTNQAFLGTLGAEGENVLDKYDFDAGFRYSEIMIRTNDRLVSASRFNNVLNANSGVGIVYNPFGYYATPPSGNAAAVAYARVIAKDKDSSSLGNPFLTVDTTHLFELPAGDVGAAGGVEYRMERLSQAPDPERVAGDIIGEVPAVATNHARKVWAGFAELKIPVIAPRQRVPGAHSFSVDVAGRYENYVTNHDDVIVPKAGIRWQPIDDTITLRGSASRGFVEPSLYQLYAGPITSINTLTDPRTNKSAGSVTTVVNSNPDLAADKTDNYNAGVVWTPNFRPLKGFTASVDWWRIDRSGTPGFSFQDTLNRYNDPDHGFSGTGLVPGEQVFLDSGGGITEVVTSYHNAGKTVIKGVDLGTGYVLPTRSWGRFDLKGAMTFIHSYRFASLPGNPLVEEVDQSTDGQGRDAILRRKAEVGLTWTRKSWSASVLGHFLDSFQNFDASSHPTRTPSTWTWDVQLSYDTKNNFGPYLKNTTLAIGAINVFDRTPPLSVFKGNSTNNYPGFIYTPEDRRLYISLEKKF